MNISTFLVTGASSGIGKDIAITLSKTANIVLCGRDILKLEDTLNKCSNENNHYIWQYDLNNSFDLESSLSNLISEKKLTISTFIHCAGYMKMIPLKMSSVDILNKSFNTNVISASLITKVLISKTNNYALNNCVFISSNISNRGAKAFSAYSASKSGLDGLMRSLSVELAPKVRVNSILPGAVRTEMTANIYENSEVIDRLKATYPLGLGVPSDITNVVAFLISDNARWITGQQITVDGGRAINITG